MRPSETIIKSVSNVWRVAKPVTSIKLHLSTRILLNLSAEERQFPTCFLSLDLSRLGAKLHRNPLTITLFGKMQRKKGRWI